jgi:addiction module HigA family antidote
MAKQLPLVHPGEVLREEFLKPLGWSVSRLAGELKVPVQRINEVVRGRRSVSADTALRLSKFLGTTPEFWMNLQTFYDLRKAANKSGPAIEREIHAIEAQQVSRNNPGILDERIKPRNPSVHGG